MNENSRTLIPCARSLRGAIGRHGLPTTTRGPSRARDVIPTALRNFVLLAIATTTAGCMLGPDNGDVDRRPDIQNAQLAPFGYYTSPSTSLSVQILSSGSADPTNNASWQTFGTATSGTQPSYFFAGDGPSQGNAPLYQWSVGTVFPVLQPSNWPQGGVARIRAWDGSVTARIFDSDWLSCPTTANTYVQFSTQCGSYANYAVLVSGTPTPADNQNPPPGRWLSTFSPDPSQAQTQLYYNAIGAGTAGPLRSLQAFQNQFGFPAGETSAIYFNNGDLGLGRQMHCKHSGSATACYVTNFADRDAQGRPIFGGNATQQQDAINQAASSTNPIATVAMVYDPLAPAGQVVKFIVYDPSGQPQPFAALDNHAAHSQPGSNQAVPTNCMACHGGGGAYNVGAQSVTGAHFLPFDPYSYVFSTAAGSPFTLDLQQTKFQQLNQLVYNAGATGAVQEMLQAMYGASGPVPGTTAAVNAIPTGWTTNWHTMQLYSNVVGPYCRTCHTSRDNGDLLAFRTYGDFAQLQSQVVSHTCVTQDMPHAEHTQRNFWASGARAHLLAWSGAAGACTPQ